MSIVEAARVLTQPLRTILEEQFGQIPQLTDIMTTIFEIIPIFDHPIVFYLVLGLGVYLTVSMVYGIIRWTLNLLTFTIKAFIVLSIIAMLYWLSIEGGEENIKNVNEQLPRLLRQGAEMALSSALHNIATPKPTSSLGHDDL
jgi:hypothetical protein